MLSRGATLPGTPHGMQARRARHSADRWRVRAEELEQDQVVLKQFVQQAVSYENDLEVQVGRLKENRDIIHSQMKMRERGLALRHSKEDTFRSDITQLNRRIDEMSSMIRQKEEQLDSLRYREAAHRQEIAILKAKLDNRNKGLGKLPDHKVDQVLKKPTIMKKKLRLPTLVSTTHPLRGSKDTLTTDRDSNMDTERSDDKEGLDKHSVHDMYFPSKSKDVCMCHMVERAVGPLGGSITLPNSHLNLPEQTLADMTMVCMSQLVMDRSNSLLSNLKAAGLHHLVHPRLQFSLQPFRTLLTKRGIMQLNIVKDSKFKSKQARIFICFMQDVDESGAGFLWRPEKASAMSSVTELAQSSVVTVELDRLCGLVIMELSSIPMVANENTHVVRFSDINALSQTNKMAPASGIVALTTAVMNVRIASCTIVAYAVAGDEETLRIVFITSSSNRRQEVVQKKRERNVTHYGSCTSRLQLCDEEVLSFYFDKDTRFTGNTAWSLLKASSEGQTCRLPFFSCQTTQDQGEDSEESEGQGQISHPSLLRIKRRVMGPQNIFEENVGIIHIQSTRRDYLL